MYNITSHTSRQPHLITSQIKLTAAQIKAVEKKKAKPTGDAKSGDSLAPLEEEEQEVRRIVQCRCCETEYDKKLYLQFKN